MNIKEATNRALQEESLLDAITFMAIWENDRAVKQAIRNYESEERNPDGSMYDTCFRSAFQYLLSKYEQTEIDKCCKL